MSFKNLYPWDILNFGWIVLVFLVLKMMVIQYLLLLEGLLTFTPLSKVFY